MLKYFSSMARAMGAATSPPPPPFSKKTVIQTSGFS